MTPHPHTGIALLLIGAVLVWAIVRRARLAIGRQALHPRPLRIRTFFMMLGIALLLMAALHQRLLLIAESTGLFVGLGLSLLGLRLTRFEDVGTQRYFQPNLYIGLTLTLLFIVRIGWRFVLLRQGLQSNPDVGAGAMQAVTASPLTAALMLCLLGYYGGYYIGLLRRAAQPAPLPEA